MKANLKFNEWPNKKGFDAQLPNGDEIEVWKPEFERPWRANVRHDNECIGYGIGETMAKAISNIIYRRK